MIAFFIVLSFWVNDFVVVCKGEKFFALTYQNLIPRPLLLAKRRGEWYNFFSVRSPLLARRISIFNVQCSMCRRT
jgi:hypothetical protein